MRGHTSERCGVGRVRHAGTGEGGEVRARGGRRLGEGACAIVVRCHSQPPSAIAGRPPTSAAVASSIEHTGPDRPAGCAAR
ncbi:hypothetical protein BV133_2581 [Blastochloris viridis]|uniref:Uncharacterized protein n=1 Tax=Blastochloris viridis TaxID=1079 RepID=A0A182D428_BLAVI|nr:hypothetical protein BV133_2581 [Blastochloris viridis]